MNERGLQNKSDSTISKWENSDFPVLCEACLGSSGFVRMIKDTFGGACKMCNRPFTVFKWRPARGEYKKTEVCQACSKVKNICQTCILDLEYGLPSQLRDAVLSEFERTSVIPQSEVNRDYFIQQQIVAMANGDDIWANRDNPNERLLKMARTVTNNREQTRIKLPPPTTASSSSSYDYISDNTSDNTKRSNSDAFRGTYDDSQQQQQQHQTTISLPPGINSMAELQLYYAGKFNPEAISTGTAVNDNSIATVSSSSNSSGASSSVDVNEANVAASTLSKFNDLAATPHDIPIPNTTININIHAATTNTKPKPPKPAGPPPPSAFKNKNNKDSIVGNTLSSSVPI